MPKCEYCGKEVLFPFVCSHCGKTFCAEHRLPENHQCPNISKEQFWYQRQKAIEGESKQEPPIREGELYFIKESKEEKEPETEKPKRKIAYLIPAFCITLILVGAITAYTSYNFGYSIASSVGYEKGYNEGYVCGNLSGYEVGYDAGYLDGNSSGYETGYNSGYIQGVTDGAGRGYNIRDPTYQEALQFIALDQTDKNQYNEENYTCLNFAADFKINAFDAGYRCGFVFVEFAEGGHAIVCFNTTDYGLIFVEPQNDNIVNLEIGQPYWDDIVVRYTIVW